ncbi:MAG: C25 family cysteine peptidase, partial [Saprospiraceae bacterium]
NIDLPSNGNISASLRIIEEEPIDLTTSYKSDIVSFANYKVKVKIIKSRNKYIAKIELLPIRFIQANKVMVLKKFTIDINYQPQTIASLPVNPFTYESELKMGQIFKISVPKKGIYKLDKSFFENKLKLNLTGINPKNIRLLGNGGTRIPESNSTLRIDDLKENKIYFSGQEDGIFNDNDYILFYATGPDQVEYDSLNQSFIYDKNSYSVKSYFFIKLDSKAGLRISKKAILGQTDYNTNKGVDYYHHEVELINLLDDDECNHGSGQQWYGEEMSNTRELDLSKEVDLSGILTNIPSIVSTEFASRASQNTNLAISIDGVVKNLSLGISPFSCTSRYATSNTFRNSFNISNSSPKTVITFPQTGVNSDGWLNYFQISYTKELQYNNGPSYIFDPSALRYNKIRYTVKSLNSTQDLISWNITNPTEISEIPNQRSSNSISFADESLNSYQSYVVFSLTDKFETPEFESIVENQNLHELDKLDMVIIYHSSLKKEAERLLKHRSNFSNLKGIAIDVDQVDNEFGSGTKDPSAIRDFMRMLYSRNPQFKYLILFGNSSFD